MTLIRTLAGIGAALVMSLASEASVTFTIENGQLTGAQNVRVGSDLYDVLFVDGSCNSLFQECGDANAPYTIAFDSQPDATAAEQALLDQVFLDDIFIGGVEYDFDDDPSLTSGCELSFLCVMRTPFAASSTTVDLAGIVNFNLSTPNASAGITSVSSEFDTTRNSATVFTVFNIQPGIQPGVPEPSTWLMMLAGFALTGFALKRRKTALAV